MVETFSPPIPESMPDCWIHIMESVDGYSLMRRDNLYVIVSGCVELDGKRWIHVSCSRKSRLPSWPDLRAVKDLFIGPNRYAYQVLPPSDRHVNIHRYCLHLFATETEDLNPMPDFARGGGLL